MIVRIIALHLAYGGIEKAIINMANIFVQKYPTEIYAVYHMPDSPAYPLNPSVKVFYLLNDIPNREEWHKAIKQKKPIAIIRESLRSIRVLLGKRKAVIRLIKSINDGVLITTRHEDNLLLSKYGNPGVKKIAQLHHDHNFEKKYVDSFKCHYSNIDIIIMLTQGLADEVTKMLPDTSKTKVVCIPNFLEHFPESYQGKREKTILSVGRLVAGKGFDRLIRIFADISQDNPEWKLKIIGEGEERVSLENLINSLDLSDRISLPGRMNSFEIEEEMCKAGIFAMTSHSEGFGFVIIEAQSCGLPVIAYDVRVGARAIITDGIDGFLIPDGKADEFENCLVKLIHDSDLCSSISANGRRRAEDFSVDNISALWFNLLES